MVWDSSLVLINGIGHTAFSFSPFIMLINGQAFEGTCDYECTNSRLKLYTGASNASCITQFRPVMFPHARMIYKLLLTLHNYHLCCFLTGAFALFVAGKLDSFDGIAIFVAMTDPKTTPI